MKKISHLVFLGILTQANALDFGAMGNTSIGMGGAGVALQSSAFGAYYNPSLISIDSKIRFGYTLGARYQQRNIDRLAQFDFKGMISNANSLVQNGGTGGGNGAMADKQKVEALYKDIKNLGDIFSQNHLAITSQNGISLQIAPGGMRGSFGSLAISYFASFYANISGSSDIANKQLIVKNGSNYYKVDASGNPTKSDEDNYKKHSIISAIDSNQLASMATTNLLLQEVPLTYAYTFFFENSNLNLGVNLKYINALFYQQRVDIGKDTNLSKITSDFKANIPSKSASNFGIDLGVSYQIDLPKFQGLTFGLVAKNINYPSFKFDATKLTIKPQYRLGIAYNNPLITFAFDADILPNEMLGFSDEPQLSQMLATGLKFDLKYLDMRVGVAKDIRQDNGFIFTTGINIFGFFDLAFQIGTKGAYDSLMPRYMALQLGGSFSF